MAAVPETRTIQCGEPPFQELTPVDCLQQDIRRDIEACWANVPPDLKQCLTIALTYTMQLVDWNLGHCARNDLFCAALMQLHDLPKNPPQPVLCPGTHRRYWEGLLWLGNIMHPNHLSSGGGSQSASSSGHSAVQSENTTLHGMLILCNRHPNNVSPMEAARDMFHEFIKRIKVFCTAIARHIEEAQTLLFPHAEKMKAINVLRKEVALLQHMQRNMIAVSGLHADLPMRTPL